jgi:CubicO group peptidase (beta-lactamase class C family)
VLRGGIAAALLCLGAAGGWFGCGGSVQEGEYLELPASSFAGLKAGMTCSAVFVAGRARADVLVDELGGLPERAALAGPPEVDRAGRAARVAWDAAEPPRLAVYREGWGCTTLPPGAGVEQARALPALEPAAPAGDPARIPWPDGDLLPEQGPADAASPALDAVVEAAFDGRSYGEGTKTIGVVVVQGGRLVAERYRPGFGPHTQYRTWSAAKTITNALVGILVGRGALELDAPAPIPEWSAPGDPRSRITLRHLLHMSSGLDPHGAGAYPVYFDGADEVAEITRARAVAEPGTRWSYANRDTLLLVRAMRQVLGDEAYWRFPRSALLDRIGMRSTFPETDPHGNFVLSSQVFSTPRDLARLGLLYLGDGVWNGERILPEGWVRFSTRPAPARTRGIGALLAYGVQGFLGYGAQIWLYQPVPFVVSHPAFSAIGHRGQYVTVVPSQELVVVRTGLDPEVGGVLWRQDRFYHDLIDALGD